MLKNHFYMYLLWENENLVKGSPDQGIMNVHQNWPPLYNWNIVESGIKHPNPYNRKSAINFKRGVHTCLNLLLHMM
jgi:hypothetical protein